MVLGASKWETRNMNMECSTQAHGHVAPYKNSRYALEVYADSLTSTVGAVVVLCCSCNSVRKTFMGNLMFEYLH